MLNSLSLRYLHLLFGEALALHQSGLLDNMRNPVDGDPMLIRDIAVDFLNISRNFRGRGFCCSSHLRSDLRALKISLFAKGFLMSNYAGLVMVHVCVWSPEPPALDVIGPTVPQLLINVSCC